MAVILGERICRRASYCRKISRFTRRHSLESRGPAVQFSQAIHYVIDVAVKGVAAWQRCQALTAIQGGAQQRRIAIELANTAARHPFDRFHTLEGQRIHSRRPARTKANRICPNTVNANIEPIHPVP